MEVSLGRWMWPNFIFSALSLALFMGQNSASAQLLQIIHTNDLHSHFDHARELDRGNYAAVKTVMDRLKLDAQKQGIETLTLDAGDFSEDSIFYLPGQGVEAWRLQSALGYDAVTLGNHDWLAGPSHLNRLVQQTQPTFDLLGANFLFSGNLPDLEKHMHRWAEFKKAGARIAVYGLTTSEFLYSWMAEPGLITDPIETAVEDLPEVRSKADFVIALTHLGMKTDKKLVNNTTGIDLVVGGHSHTATYEPAWAKSADQKWVPVIQAGMHGRFVGDLLVDVEPGKPMQILRYQLIPIYSAEAHDSHVDQMIDEARRHLENDYGKEWLQEVIGNSEVPLENAYVQGRKTWWSEFVAKSIRDAGKADASVDVTQFEGFDQPAGPITREQLFILYPRIFEFEKRYGWTVWTANVWGWFLKAGIQKAIALGVPLHFSGITYDTAADGTAMNFKINGEPFHWYQRYKIAFPEGIIRGAFGLNEALKLVLSSPKDTRVPIWQANEDHLKEVKVIRESHTD